MPLTCQSGLTTGQAPDGTAAQGVDARTALLAGLREAAAGDPRVHAEIVQGTRENRHRDGGRLIAVPGWRGVLVTLASGDGADDQPHNEYQCSDVHGHLRQLTDC